MTSKIYLPLTNRHLFVDDVFDRLKFAISSKIISQATTTALCFAATVIPSTINNLPIFYINRRLSCTYITTLEDIEALFDYDNTTGGGYAGIAFSIKMLYFKDHSILLNFENISFAAFTPATMF